MEIQRKVCNRCEVEKPLTEYYKNSRSKDGHLPRCKVCHSKVAKKLKEKRVSSYTPPPKGYRKICTKCEKEKPGSSFHKHRANSDGLDYWCRDCKTHYKQRHYIGTKEYQSKKAKEWYAKNSEHAKRKARDRHQRLRQEALIAYSKGNNPSCGCCGETEYKFLGIDHIDGGGKQHLAEIGATNVYYWTKKRGYPEGFQVLCHNCNLAKGFYGQCPHQNDQGTLPK